ncbi:MAG: dihydrofolate reductase [archaeon]
MTDLVILAAVAENNVIGKDGKMLWHISEDLKRFKKLTMNEAVIMGRNTYDSIISSLGRPLGKRFNVVLTSKPIERFDVIDCNSIDKVLDYCDGREKAYIIGGEQIYNMFMPWAQRLEITEVHKAYDGDVFFPKIDPKFWKETKREDHDGFSFVSYDRKIQWPGAKWEEKDL